MMKTLLVLTAGLVLGGLAACDTGSDEEATALSCQQMMAANPELMGAMMADSAMRDQMMGMMMQNPEMRGMMMDRMMADPETRRAMMEGMRGMMGTGGMEGMMPGMPRDSAGGED